MSTFLLLWGVVLTPAAAALIAANMRRDDGARRAAILGAALTLALSVGALLLALAGGPGAALDAPGPVLPLVGARLHLGLDGYSVVLPALTAFLLLALLVGGPRSALDRGHVVALLATASATLGVLCALDLAVLAAAWVATLIPGDRLLARGGPGATLLRRTYRIFLFGGAVPLLAAVALLASLTARGGGPLSFDIQDIARAGVPERWQPLLFVLVGLAVLMRMAVVPFHSWLPALFERGPLGVTLLLAEMQVGVCVLLRVAVPLLPTACADDMPILAALGLLSAVYGAVLALVQTDLRRMIGYLAASQKGVVLLGIASLHTLGVSGALLQAVGSAISLTGLAMVVWALEARTGTADTRKLGGLVTRMPRVAAFFFLLGCAAIGFPGALTFVSEDLLFHGVLPLHPGMAALMLGATAINGITLFRAFQRAFLGPRPHRRSYEETPGLILRERAVLLGLVALTVTLGLAPNRLLAVRQPSVERLLAHVARGAHAAEAHVAELRGAPR